MGACEARQNKVETKSFLVERTSSHFIEENEGFQTTDSADNGVSSPTHFADEWTSIFVFRKDFTKEQTFLH
jgi:hypothetical protein